MEMVKVELFSIIGIFFILGTVGTILIISRIVGFNRLDKDN